MSKIVSKKLKKMSPNKNFRTFELKITLEESNSRTVCKLECSQVKKVKILGGEI